MAPTSFGHHNNARLQVFLDNFGFDYEFKSSTIAYKAGEFDETLLSILRNYEKVINVILPTLGEERRKTYSPFLPICPKTGIVLQVPVVERDEEAGIIVYEEEGTRTEVPVTVAIVNCNGKQIGLCAGELLMWIMKCPART